MTTPFRRAKKARGAGISWSLASRRTTRRWLAEAGPHAPESQNGWSHPSRPLRGMLVIGAAALFGGIAIAAEDTKITIDNSKLTPERMTVAAGSTITWVNSDDNPHNIVVPTLEGCSHPMNKEQLFTFRFDKPGIYDSMCGLHPLMRGNVVMED
jgi:plastocyanin